MNAKSGGGGGGGGDVRRDTLILIGKEQRTGDNKGSKPGKACPEGLLTDSFLYPLEGAELLCLIDTYLETGLVESSRLIASRAERLVQVLSVNVPIKPLGHIGGREDSKGFGSVVSLLEIIPVQHNVVAGIGELPIVIFVEVRLTAARGVVKLLCSAAKDDIGTVPLGPSVVGVAVEHHVYNLRVRPTLACMRINGSRCSISHSRSSDDSDVTSPDSLEELRNSLYFGVIEGIRAGVCVYS